MNVRRTNSMRQTGFTLIEILVTLGIVALIAAILLPVLARVREKSRQTACASNLHQLGLAIFAYTQDYDERHPVASKPNLSTGLPGVNGGIGWAGRIYPYVKSANTFACPDDPTKAVAAGSLVPVSYALNNNLSPAPSSATLTAPASTVLLFEVAADQAAITLPDEGLASLSPPQTSAAGDGTNGALTNLTGRGIMRLDGAVYATGLMDNRRSASLLPFDQYQNPNGRHAKGSNFLAADGHAKWQMGTSVSCGGNALAASNPQSVTGCSYQGLGTRGGFPCAEGAANGMHALTFSVL